MSNVIHKPVPSKVSCTATISSRPSVLIPSGPPRYRPPPEPQQVKVKQSYFSSHHEKQTDIISDHLKGITNSNTDENRISKTDTSSNSGSETSHQLHTTAVQQQNIHISSQNMLKFVRKPEVESVRNANEQIRKMAIEIRNLKEANQRLSDDNQELRDLCCFLDDDRQKGRKLAREWQRFGRYTASVMRQEVSAYQTKLRELDVKQQELIKDNLELKELCLYLDEERNGVCRSCGAGLGRDDGDGSSSSTNLDEAVNMPVPVSQPPTNSIQSPTLHHHNVVPYNMTVNETTDMNNTADYIQRLEMKVKQLENEKQILLTRMKLDHRSFSPAIVSSSHNQWKSSNEEEYGSRPEAVVQALQVLEVREQLEGSNRGSDGELSTHDMDDGERALLREMCNVVWRKLEEVSNHHVSR